MATGGRGRRRLAFAVGALGPLALLLALALASGSPDGRDDRRAAVPAKKASFDSEAPATAPAHWLPPEDWVYNHWLPTDRPRPTSGS